MSSSGRRWTLASLRCCEARDVFILSVSLLVVVGVVMVFSASAFHRLAEGDPYYFLRRQMAWLAIGVLGAVFFYQLDYRVLRLYHGYILAGVVVLLALVLVPQIGRVVNASRRWLPLGGGMQVQPSELAKLATVLFVAGFLATDPSRARQFWRGFLPVCLVLFLVFGLVLVEPDFGSSVFIAALAFSLLVLGGMRWYYLLGSAVIFAPVLGIFIHLRWEQIHNRLLGFLDPEGVYQVKHSLRALGSGGWFGQGLGAGAQKLRFLPEAHTDFVFSILGEELGFVGCVATIVLFIAVLWSGAVIVLRTRDLFGFLVGAGITLALGLQAALNIAVVTASAPTKGIPLPFLTFGGSGLCMTLAQVGILLSIERVESGRRAVESDASRAEPAGRHARTTAGGLA